MQKVRLFRDRSPFSLRIGALQVQTLSRTCTKTLRKRAEQTTEQKAEQNRRTDTNNAERLDEIEIASSGLDPSFLVERPTNTTHFRSVDFTPRSRSLCSGSHNTNPFGILNSQKGFGLEWKILSGNVRLKPLSGSNSVPEESLGINARLVEGLSTKRRDSIGRHKQRKHYAGRTWVLE